MGNERVPAPDYGPATTNGPWGYGPEPEPAPTAGPRSLAGETSCEAHYERDVSRPRGTKPALDQLVDHEGARRMIDAGSAYDAGEHVVGSHPTFRVSAPGNGDAAGRPAMMIATVTGGGDAFATTSRMPTPLAAGDHMPGGHTFEVLFHPSRVGEVTGELTISMQWSDGHVERERIQLRGRGKPIEKPTEKLEAEPVARPPVSLAPALPASGQNTPYPRDASDALIDATAKARLAGAAIHNSMVSGVNAVRLEALSYTLEQEKDPIWYDLAELALTIATAGIGAGVSKAMGPSLQGLLGLSAEAAKESATYRGIEKTLEYGLRDIGRSAGTAALVKAKTLSRRAEDRATSSDVVTNFFMAQEAGVSAYDSHLGALIEQQSEALRPLLLSSQPTTAGESMKSLEAALSGTATVADALQIESSTAAWVGLQARVHHGSHVVSTGAASTEVVTDMADARFRGETGPISGVAPEARTGLLDIHVSLDDAGVRITGARLNGVAVATLRRLERMNLVANRIPLRVIVGDATVITRDEVGQIRIAGDMRFLGLPATTEEPDALATARTIMDQVVGQSLAARSITIEDNDGSDAAKNQRRVHS